MSNIRQRADSSGVDSVRRVVGGAVEGRSADTSVRYVGIPARPL